MYETTETVDDLRKCLRSAGSSVVCVYIVAEHMPFGTGELWWCFFQMSVKWDQLTQGRVLFIKAQLSLMERKSAEFELNGNPLYLFKNCRNRFSASSVTPLARAIHWLYTEEVEAEWQT